MKEQGKKTEIPRETLENIKKLTDAAEQAKQERIKRFGPPIELPDLDEADPKIIAFRKEMADLFGPMDPDPPTAEETMNEYFNRPEDPEVVRQRIERGKIWKKMYEEGKKRGYYNT